MTGPWEFLLGPNNWKLESRQLFLCLSEKYITRRTLVSLQKKISQSARMFWCQASSLVCK